MIPQIVRKKFEGKWKTYVLDGYFDYIKEGHLAQHKETFLLGCMAGSMVTTEVKNLLLEIPHDENCGNSKSMNECRRCKFLGVIAQRLRRLGA